MFEKFNSINLKKFKNYILFSIFTNDIKYIPEVYEFIQYACSCYLLNNENCTNGKLYKKLNIKNKDKNKILNIIKQLSHINETEDQESLSQEIIKNTKEDSFLRNFLLGVYNDMSCCNRDALEHLQNINNDFEIKENLILYKMNLKKILELKFNNEDNMNKMLFFALMYIRFLIARQYYYMGDFNSALNIYDDLQIKIKDKNITPNITVKIHNDESFVKMMKYDDLSIVQFKDILNKLQSSIDMLSKEKDKTQEEANFKLLYRLYLNLFIFHMRFPKASKQYCKNKNRNDLLQKLINKIEQFNIENLEFINYKILYSLQENQKEEAKILLNNNKSHFNEKDTNITHDIRHKIIFRYLDDLVNKNHKKKFDIFLNIFHTFFEKQCKLEYEHSKNVADLGLILLDFIKEQDFECFYTIKEELTLNNNYDMIEKIFSIMLILHDLDKSILSKEVLDPKKKYNKSEYILKKIQNIHTLGLGNFMKEFKVFLFGDDLDLLDKIIISQRQHHENFDGSGYPKGLKENEINIIAQLIRILDSLEAKISPFREYGNGAQFINMDEMDLKQSILDDLNENSRWYSPIFLDIIIDAINRYPPFWNKLNEIRKGGK